MASMLDSLMGSLQSSGGLGQMGSSLGLDESDISKVVAGALPALLGGLNRNTNSSDGASGLLAALDRDHDGSIMDDLAGFLGDTGNADAGGGILGHAFGGNQGRVETALSQSSGIDAASVGKVMAMLAPIVMGYLGQQKRQQGLNANGLSELLGQEQQIAQQRAPEAADMFSRLLDANDDGSIMDDVAKMGSGLLGGLFKT